MSSVVRHLFAALAASLLATGCSHVTQSTATVVRNKPSGVRLSQAEAISIAGEAAAKKGFRLTDYKNPQARYEVFYGRRMWSVFYDGKDSFPGNHLLVMIDDQTGEVEVIPGL